MADSLGGDKGTPRESATNRGMTGGQGGDYGPQSSEPLAGALATEPIQFISVTT